MTTSSNQPPDSSEHASQGKGSWRVPVCHPNLYMWLVFVSALDVIMTRVILFFGGTEINPIADFVIDNWGRLGMSIFKFIIVAFVIIVCEFISRRNLAVSRRLAIASILISMVPVCWSSYIMISIIADPPARQDGDFDMEGIEVRSTEPSESVPVTLVWLKHESIQDQPWPI
ncbi:MAG: DUF5658 family protein [Phycisphaerales bacterium]|nr:DUF5658 family protein [Phycisphaerales bacterium]